MDDRARRRRPASRCGPTTRCVEAEEPDAACAGGRRWRSRRSSGSCASRPPRSRWRPSRPAARRSALTLDQRPRGWARFSPFQLRAAARRQAEAALDGLAELLGDGSLMRWWGWGEDGHAVPLSPAAEDLLRRRARRRSGRAQAARCRSSRCRLPEPALPGGAARAPRRRRSAPSSVRDDRETRVAHAVGTLATPTSCGCGRATRPARPTPWCSPARPEMVRGRAAACAPSSAWRWCRSAAARASSAGWSRVREGFAARRLARPEPAVGDRGGGPRVAHRARRRRPARPGAGAAAARAGRDARPLPAVVRVLDARRLGGHALGRPGVDRLRADRRAGARGCAACAGGRARHAGGAGHRGRAEPARAGGGLRGRARRDLRGDAARAPARPSARRYEGWSFASFAEGVDALRVLEQAGAAPDVARLSDEEETRLSLALASTGGTTERARPAPTCGCAGTRAAAWRSSASRASAERRRAAPPGAPPALLRAGGGLSLGRRPGEAWQRGRFAAPYLRDDLLDRGVLVETLETATTLDRTSGSSTPPCGGALRDVAVAAAARRRSSCATSPTSIRSGASLYFTFLARQEDGAELRAVAGGEDGRLATRSSRTAARSPTTTRSAATTRPGWRPRTASSGSSVLRAAKRALDPAGIMNPGKLLP